MSATSMEGLTFMSRFRRDPGFWAPMNGVENPSGNKVIPVGLKYGKPRAFRSEDL
jgi:hypothetical protein